MLQTVRCTLRLRIDQAQSGCGRILQDLPRVIRKGDRRLEIVVLEASVWTKLG